MDKLTERISLKVTAELKARLLAACKRDSRSVNNLAIVAFNSYLAESDKAKKPAGK